MNTTNDELDEQDVPFESDEYCRDLEEMIARAFAKSALQNNTVTAVTFVGGLVRITVDDVEALRTFVVTVAAKEVTK